MFAVCVRQIGTVADKATKLSIDFLARTGDNGVAASISGTNLSIRRGKTRSGDGKTPLLRGRVGRVADMAVWFMRRLTDSARFAKIITHVSTARKLPSKWKV